MDDQWHHNQEHSVARLRLVAVAKGNFLFTVAEKGFDIASLVMLAGGLFLIYKSVREIHKKLEGEDANLGAEKRKGLGLARLFSKSSLLILFFHSIALLLQVEPQSMSKS
jgi:predicted tellurium resistance membrane protein TerC